MDPDQEGPKPVDNLHCSLQSMNDVLLELEVEETGLLPHGVHHGEHLHWQQLGNLGNDEDDL